MSFDITQTIISQYANSPTINRLISDFHGYVNPDDFIQGFYDSVWNIKTAKGIGLDIWGRIVDISRIIEVDTNPQYIGFEQNETAQTFGHASFFNGTQATSLYRMGDDAYRRAILFKAALNIGDYSIPFLNAALTTFFDGRGRVYVVNLGNMQMEIVCEFPLIDYELSILTRSNTSPHPAGVLLTVTQLDNNLIGFKQNTTAQTFNNGSLRT